MDELTPQSVVKRNVDRANGSGDDDSNISEAPEGQPAGTQIPATPETPPKKEEPMQGPEPAPPDP